MSLALAKTPIEVMDPFREQIEAALKYAHGTHIWEDLVEAVGKQDLQFWPAEKSFLLTEIVQYPRKRLLHVFLAGGSLEEIERMEPSLATFAERLDCDFISLAGRPGWKKVLDKHGYAPAWTYMIKELPNGR